MCLVERLRVIGLERLVVGRLVAFGCFWCLTGFLDVFCRRLLFYAGLVGCRDFWLGYRALPFPVATGCIHSRSGNRLYYE